MDYATVLTHILCALIEERGLNPDRYRNTDALVSEAKRAAKKIADESVTMTEEMVTKLREGGLI